MTALSENGVLGRILVATDGSDYSAGAIRTGVALAKSLGAHLTGLSVSLYNPEYSTLVPNLGEEAEKRAREALASFSAEAGVDAETVTIEASDPYQGILEGARANQADLIVIGRRGKRGLARMMVGDATAKVIGHADCAVLVAPRACGDDASCWRPTAPAIARPQPVPPAICRSRPACPLPWFRSSSAATTPRAARKPRKPLLPMWSDSRNWASRPKAVWWKVGRMRPSPRRPRMSART